MNEEEKETTKEQSAAQALIENTEEIVDTAAEGRKAEPVSPVKEDADDENKIFRKYKIKDIVFLAIMAACMLVTGAIMPARGEYSRVRYRTGLPRTAIFHLPRHRYDEGEKDGFLTVYVRVLRRGAYIYEHSHVRVHPHLRGHHGSAHGAHLPRLQKDGRKRVCGDYFLPSDVAVPVYLL